MPRPTKASAAAARKASTGGARGCPKSTSPASNAALLCPGACLQAGGCHLTRGPGWRCAEHAGKTPARNLPAYTAAGDTAGVHHALADVAKAATPAPALGPGDTFAFTCPARSFRSLEKSDQGRQNRIAGIITAERDDVQGELVLQKGLDFSEFLGRWGFFNDDHGKRIRDVVGVPETVTYYPEGSTLPDDTVASANCTWCEGALTDDDAGRALWDKAQALQKLGRSLGFSIEGDVTERKGDSGRVIAKAMVRHVAITHQPVMRDVKLGVLLRSLAVGLGQPGAAGPVMPGTYSGDQSGRAYLKEDLSDHIEVLDSPRLRAKRRKRAKKSPAPGKILESIYRALPGVSPDYALALLAKLDRNRSH